MNTSDLTNRNVNPPERMTSDLLELSRETIRAQQGNTLEDSVNYYKDVMSGIKPATQIQMAARARIDKLLALEPQQKQAQSDVSAVADLVRAVQSLAQTRGTRIDAVWKEIEEADTPATFDLTKPKNEVKYGEKGEVRENSLPSPKKIDKLHKMDTIAQSPKPPKKPRKPRTVITIPQQPYGGDGDSSGL